MTFIKLHKYEGGEVNRVDPNDIRTIGYIEDGSIVTFKDNDSMRYRETPAQIESKEWRMHYLWPNLEKLVVGIIGGIIGSLVTLLIAEAAR